MNKLAALLLFASFCLFTGGASMLSIPAGLITAGVLAGVGGVMSLNASPKTPSTEREPR